MNPFFSSIVILAVLAVATPVWSEQPAMQQVPVMKRAAPVLDARPQSKAKVLSARDFDRLLANYHRSGKPIPGQQAAPRSGAATQLKMPGKPVTPKYEIADCGDGQVCCSYSGENSTCNLFMYLCTSQGGQATGDKDEAVCTF